MLKLSQFSRVRMTWSWTTTGQSPSCQYLIFEKLMYNRLKTFLDKDNMLYHHQHGVRVKCSTQHALIGTVNRIQLNDDKKLFCCGIFMDRKKAFDTVNHWLNPNAKTRTLRNLWSSKYLVFLSSKWSTSNHSGWRSRVPTLPYSHKEHT